MSNSIELSLFDFIDELADDVSNGTLDWQESIDGSSASVLFCESFFDQFFATLGHDISGFTHRAKVRASKLALRLRQNDKSSTTHTRKIIVMYEEFCDMYDDISGGYGHETPTTYEDFHMNYLSRLLRITKEWADSRDYNELADRISDAQETLNRAMG